MGTTAVSSLPRVHVQEDIPPIILLRSERGALEQMSVVMLSSWTYIFLLPSAVASLIPVLDHLSSFLLSPSGKCKLLLLWYLEPVLLLP